MHRVIYGTVGLALAGLSSACSSLKEVEIGTCILNDDGSVANPTECGCANGVDDDAHRRPDRGVPEFPRPGDAPGVPPPAVTTGMVSLLMFRARSRQMGRRAGPLR